MQLKTGVCDKEKVGRNRVTNRGGKWFSKFGVYILSRIRRRKGVRGVGKIIFRELRIQVGGKR